MNVLLWCLQILLAVAFLYSGICKSLFSEEKLVRIGQTGVRGLPPWLIRFIGITELLGVAGIVLPWATGLCRIMTPVTALCFALVMIPAAVIHYRLREPKNIMTNVLLFSAAVVVAIGRMKELF